MDILSRISGVRFADAWLRRIVLDIEGIEVPVNGRADLIANKRASGRPRDLPDIELLGEEVG